MTTYSNASALGYGWACLLPFAPACIRFCRQILDVTGLHHQYDERPTAYIGEIDVSCFQVWRVVGKDSVLPLDVEVFHQLTEVVVEVLEAFEIETAPLAAMTVQKSN